VRTRTEEALGLGHPLERKKAKERSRSFGFGQAGAGQSCCWGEANKTTKERGAEQAEMLLLCVASHAAPGIRSGDPYRHQQQAGGVVNCHCGLWKAGMAALQWHAKTTIETRLLSRRSAAKPHAAVSPYSLRLDGWSGYFWLVLLHQKASQDFENLSYQLLQSCTALQCCAMLHCYYGVRTMHYALNSDMTGQTVIASSATLVFLAGRCSNYVGAKIDRMGCGCCLLSEYYY